MSSSTPSSTNKIRRPVEIEKHYRRDIQGLRAFSLLAVVFYHARFGLEFGYLGVDMFLVISGYVVGGVILREVWGSQSFEFRRFLSRRFWRLYPSLLVVVAFSLAVFFILSGSNQLHSLLFQSLSSITGTSNLYFWSKSGDYFAIGDGVVPLLHTWSLSLEEQFYLLLGASTVSLLVLRKKLHRRLTHRGIMVTALLLIFASLLADFMSVWSLSGKSSLVVNSRFYLLPARAWQFLLGIICYLKFGGSKKQWHPAVVIGMVAGLLVVIGAWTSNPFSLLLVTEMRRLLASVLTAAILVRRSSLLESGCLTWLGDRSYGIYLWHFPILASLSALGRGSALDRITAVVVAVLLAAFSYRLVESPFRKHAYDASEKTKNHRESRANKFRMAWITSVTVFLLVLVSMNPQQFFIRSATSQPNLSEEIQNHLLQMDCRSLVMGGIACGDNLSETVLLLGDSHAWSLAPGFISASRTLQIPYSVRTFPGCFPLPASGYRHTSKACEGWRESLRREVEREHPRVVFLAMCTRLSKGCPEGVTRQVVPELVDVVADALSASFSPKTTFVIADPIPLLLVDPDSNDSIFSRLVYGNSDSVALDLGRMRHARAFQEQLRSELNGRGLTVGESPEIFASLCTDSKCLINDSNLQKRLFKDTNHLSLQGSLQTVPKLQDLLRELWFPLR